MHPSASNRTLHRRDFGFAAGVFVLALLVRLLFLFSHGDGDWPHSIYYEGDAPEWIRWAQAIDAGKPYESGLPLRSPGVAHLLQVLGAGEENLKVFVSYKVLWCVISAATCAISYLGFAMVL